MKVKPVKMGHIFFPILISFVFCLPQTVYAQKLDDADPYEYNDMILEIKSVGSPYITNGYAIFTLPDDSESAGIAFDFEQYATVHPYNIRSIRDQEDNVTYSCKFFALKLPEAMSQIRYRVVIGGLWACDPLNSDYVYDLSTGLLVSVLQVPQDFSSVTKIIGTKDTNEFTHVDNGARTVRFVYQGEAGQKVRLAGSFSNWDSWIYFLQETSPGKYHLDLCLSTGTYFYSYYTGMTSFIDTTNPHKGYTQDGKAVSIITVQ